MSINIASEIVHFAGRIAGSPAPAAVPISRCSVSSVRACVHCLAWLALHLARPVLLPVLCSLSGCAGAGVSTGGVYSRRPAPPGQSLNHRKNKKGSKNHPTPYCQSQKFPAKTKKTPTKGLRSVLYLPYKP